jgi:hypothetical protein
MTHPGRHRLAVVLVLLFGVLPRTAAAIDSATIKGQLRVDGRTHTLTHALAWQPTAPGEELWIFLTDVELPPAAAQDPARVEGLVAEGRLHGVKLVVDAKKPDPAKLNGTLFLPVPAGSEDMPAFWESEGAAGWDALSLGNERVVGSLFVGAGAGLFSSGARKFADTPAWSLEAEFSAPVFGPGGGTPAAGGERTLTGAQAQQSPQGEARRRQIDKVVVDGDAAVLDARSGPNAVDVARLVRTKNGWKIGK